MLEPLGSTASDLQRLLQGNQITSVQIVEQYFAQIDRYDTRLKAFISLAPRHSVLRIATLLDKERKQGNTRSPLHGIPIALKVSCLLLYLHSMAYPII